MATNSGTDSFFLFSLGFGVLFSYVSFPVLSAVVFFFLSPID